MLRSEYNIATSEFTTYDSIEMHIYYCYYYCYYYYYYY